MNPELKTAGRVLLADANSDSREQMALLLADAGFAVDQADISAVVSAAATDLFDVALLDAIDLRTGAEVLAAVRAADPLLAVIFLVPYREVDRMAAAFALGPQHFIAKPARRDALIAAVAAAIDVGRGTRRNTRARVGPGFDALLGFNSRLLTALELGRKAAATKQPVCIFGETGTGKSILANAIHSASPRRGLPLIDEVLAGMSPDQQRDALFGHTAGAFTGAERARSGLLHDAHQSTLFLDEIADVSPEVQLSLLRFLDKGTFRPLGSNRDTPSDLRLIVATNADLAGLVAAGRFRRDLFERFGPFQITLPPLRERSGDVPGIAEYYARQAVSRGESAPLFTEAAMTRLSNYPWPGNVRQLKLVVEAAVAVAGGEPIRPEHCLLRATDGEFHRPEGNDDYDLQLEEFLDTARRRYFAELNDRYRSVAEIAERAGLHPSNVRKWLKKYGLSAKDGN